MDLLKTFFKKSAKNQEEYLTAGRNTKFFPLVAILVMTEINPMALIVMASMGYLFGGWALWMAVNALLGPLFASFVTSKKWKEFDSTCISKLFDENIDFDIGNHTTIAN